MKPNDELAPDAVRHDDIDHGGEEGGIETKASRPLGPISRRLAQRGNASRRAADPTASIVSALDAQTREIKAMAQRGGPRVSVPAQRPSHVRHQTLHELRATAERRDAAVRAGRPDPLYDQQMARMNSAIDRATEQENRELRAENRRLQRKAARPMGPTGLPGLPAGRSQRSAALAMYRKAANQYLRTGEESFMGQSLRQLERKVGLNAESLPNGGVFVHPEHDTTVESLLQEVVPMRQLATVRQISAGEFKKAVNLRGTQALWVDERPTPRPDTDGPEVDELSFPAMELYAAPMASQTLLEDSLIDVESWLAEEVVDAFALAEGVAFISGNGIKKPLGLLAHDTVPNGSWVWGKIGYVATGVDGGFAAPGDQVNQGDKLWSLIYGLKQGHRQGAKFLMNRGTIGLCRTLKDGEGRWIWSDARDGNPNQLCGYEVVEGEQMPDVATGSMSIAFGDFAKGYLIIDRVGLSVLRDPYTKHPHVVFKTRKRVGGGIQNFEAIKLLKFAAT